MPYWWDMEYDYNQTSGGQARATSFCSSRTGDTRINTNSLQCYFELQGPNGQKIRWTQGCYDNPHLPLIDTAFNSAKITYGMNIFP